MCLSYLESNKGKRMLFGNFFHARKVGNHQRTEYLFESTET